jgi:protein TonB
MSLADSAHRPAAHRPAAHGVSLASADGYWAAGRWTGEHPARRWAISLGAVLAVHGVAFFIATRVPPAPPVETPPAMVVDLAIPAPPPPVPVQPQPVPPQPVTPPPPPPPKVLAPDPIPLPPKPPKHPHHKPVHKPPPKPVVVQPPVPAPQPPIEAPPPKPAAPAAPSPQVTANYVSQLLGQLERYKEYPEDARRKGQEGSPTIHVVIDRQGKLLSATLVHSSGHASLDDEAVEMARRAAPFPPLPNDMSGQTWSSNVKIDFNVRH